LQHSLASYEQEKQAAKVNITDSVLPLPRDRFDAARQEKLLRRKVGAGASGNGLAGSSVPSSPFLSGANTPRPVAPTSAPASEETVKVKAMKMVLVHLLAIRPLDNETLMNKTQIPKLDLEEILPRVGRQVDGKWQLSDRAYRDLDPWSFPYPSKSDREAAIANAVKAFDRLRLGKDEKLWQILLSPSERGKGVVLSRLHLGSSAQGGKGLTPSYHPSPVLHSQSDGLGERGVVSGANTPRAPGGLTPRPGSSRGGVVKRLLSRDPKKARAAEEAKEKKRKERETAAAGSDREAGRPVKKLATKKNNLLLKSEEFVRSEDEESGDDADAKKPECRKHEGNRGASPGARKGRAGTLSSRSSDAPLKSKSNSTLATQRPPSNSGNNDSAAKAKSSTPRAKSPAPGATTPQPQPTKNDKPSASSVERKSQQGSRVSSANGHDDDHEATRARIFSPQGRSGDLKEGRARVDTVLGTADTARHVDEPDLKVNALQRSDNGTPEKLVKQTATSNRQASTNGTRENNISGIKRLVDRDASQDGIVVKKHKITPTASPRPNSQPKQQTPLNNNNDTSPQIESLTYDQALTFAHSFQETYYPAYKTLYDALQGKLERGEAVGPEEHGRLMAMHRRLEGMKGEILAAAGNSEKDDEQ